MHRSLCALVTTVGLLAFLVPAPATANPIDAVFENLESSCDDLPFLDLSEELGDLPSGISGPGFPPGEALLSSSFTHDVTTCGLPSDGGIDDWVVSITNLTVGAFEDLYFVVNEGGFMSNFDGFVTDFTGGGAFPPGGLAFKIDDVGVNTPLISESITPDLIFEPGETWQFIVVDFTPGASPTPFLSLGLSSGTIPSSASIMANVFIPEPGTGLLLGLGLAGLAGHRRRGGR